MSKRTTRRSRITKGYQRYRTNLENDKEIDYILRESYDVDIIENENETQEEEREIDISLSYKYLSEKTISLTDVRDIIRRVKEDNSISIAYKIAIIIKLSTNVLEKQFSENIPQRMINIATIIISMTLTLLGAWHLSAGLVFIKNVRKILKELSLYYKESKADKIVGKIVQSVDLSLVALGGTLLFAGHSCEGNLGCLAAKSVLLFIL